MVRLWDQLLGKEGSVVLVEAASSRQYHGYACICKHMYITCTTDLPNMHAGSYAGFLTVTE